MRVAIFLFFLPSVVFSQTDSVRKASDVLRFVDGVAYTAIAPARWESKDWITLGGVLTGTAALMFADESVRDFWQRRDSPFLDRIERVGFHYGKPYSAVAFTAGFYLTGMILNNDWWKDTGLMLGTALLTSGFTQTLMKDAVGRARPGSELGIFEFNPFSQSPAYHSFPSGHQAVAMTISLVIARRTKYLPLQLVMYSLATTTAISRMYSDSHWISDIAFGGVLAWFCADTAIHRLHATRVKRPFTHYKTTWKVFPYPGGLTLRASL